MDTVNVTSVMVDVWDCNDQLVRVPLATLIAWKGALKLESLGMRNSRGSVAALVRRKLSATVRGGWDATELHRYISDVVSDALRQLES